MNLMLIGSWAALGVSNIVLIVAMMRSIRCMREMLATLEKGRKVVEEMERMRGMSATFGGMPMVRLLPDDDPNDPYIDPHFKPRRCNREACGKEYRGPAVYCSLACAEADA